VPLHRLTPARPNVAGDSNARQTEPDRDADRPGCGEHSTPCDGADDRGDNAVPFDQSAQMGVTELPLERVAIAAQVLPPLAVDNPLLVRVARFVQLGQILINPGAVSRSQLTGLPTPSGSPEGRSTDE
jgi:hypothetical protein